MWGGGLGWLGCGDSLGVAGCEGTARGVGGVTLMSLTRSVAKPQVLLKPALCCTQLPASI